MPKEYKLPQSLFVARTPVQITGYQPIKGGGLRLQLGCGHTVDTVSRTPPSKQARITCPICHPIFDRTLTRKA